MEIFITIKECGSFSEAARILTLPRSTVSSRMAKLEETLGVKLIQRTSKSFHITPLGELFFLKSLEILSKVHEMENLVQQISDTPKGRLRILLPHEFAVVFLQKAIRTFLDRFPQVQLDLNLSTRNADLIQEGYDLAFRVGHLADSSLISLKLGTVEWGIYAHPKLLKKLPPIQTPRDIPLDHCLSFKAGKVMDWVFLTSEGKLQTITPSGRLQVNSMIMLAAAAAAEQGIAALNIEIARTYEEEGKLVRLLEDYPLVESEIYALYPSRKFLLPTVRVFLDFIKQEMKNEKNY